MRVAIASLAEVDQIWPLFADGFSHACRRTGSIWNAGSLWHLCRSGNAFLITVIEDTNADMQMIRKFHMASIWRFEQEDGESVFRCVGMHGKNMKAWLPMARQFIEKMARDNGATALTAEGRDGWARVFGATRTGKTYKVAI